MGKVRVTPENPHGLHPVGRGEALRSAQGGKPSIVADDECVCHHGESDHAGYIVAFIGFRRMDCRKCNCDQFTRPT